MRKKINVGLASCGISAGGDQVYETLQRIIDETGCGAELGRTGCIGACFSEVIVDVIDDTGITTYARVTPENAGAIINEHVMHNRVVEELLLSRETDIQESYFSRQKRIVLRNAGRIDPENIDEYINEGGYRALSMVLETMASEDVRAHVSRSGLRGRGGAGFLTGTKWDLAAQSESATRYMVCNADEGDPGAFMDRSVLEGDPHAVLEGLTIAAYGIDASYGYIYVRSEYPLAVERLKKALVQSRAKGYLGENILDSGFSFDIELKIGAGAFVCGEETALMASIEGKRGMPVIRPPYPTEQGIWGAPTVINNVETLANVPYIFLKGWKEFASGKTGVSSGTKVFALTGKINRTGLIEVPMGITLRDVIFDIGGGIKGGRQFKAVQLGGPSGGCIPAELLDTPIDYDSLVESGAMMGSGGMVVMDDSTCMVDVAKFFMNFIRSESCGKCTYCRVGTRRLHEILKRITEGDGEESDIDKLEKLSREIRDGSLCGLGKTAANPVLTTLRYFGEEYLEHVREGTCRAKVCKPLLTYTIDPDACTGCTLCAKNCPADAITGERKETHVIDQEKCIKCGDCFSVCTFDAVVVE